MEDLSLHLKHIMFYFYTPLMILFYVNEICQQIGGETIPVPFLIAKNKLYLLSKKFIYLIERITRI